MISFSEKEIDTIAQDLDCGFNYYINTDTWEKKAIIDLNESYGDDEIWRQDLEEIEENWTNYIVLNKMISRESFEIMESFLLKVSNKKMKQQLINALNRNKPFRHFKYAVDNHEDTRQQWFKHKATEYQKYVKTSLRLELEAKEIELVLTKTINFKDTNFRLTENSTNGLANKDTLFKFDQIDEVGKIVIGKYFGGNILLGDILGLVEGSILNMNYQCITVDNELKSGEATAQISFTEQGKMKLKVDWHWLSGSQTNGTAAFIEVDK